jgi:hypothetical protein
MAGMRTRDRLTVEWTVAAGTRRMEAAAKDGLWGAAGFNARQTEEAPRLIGNIAEVDENRSSRR